MGKTRDYNGLADYIIQEEGFLDKPTNIGDGKITLGSGLTDPKWHNLYKQRGNKWSKEDNKKAVIEEIKMREKILADSFPNWDKLPIDSQNALISYKYNYNFTPSNSPKLYQAARDFNYLNMAAQMDATSKDPKFRKGLMERRKREQEMFLSGFPSGKSIVKTASPAVEQPDATTVYNPYPVQLEYTKPALVMVPDEDSYVTAHRLTDSEIKAQQIQEKFDAINRYNALMDSISVQNNPTPQYKPQNAPYVIAPYAEGGFMQPKDAWDKLSLQEKSAMMRAAVRQGIYNLKDIRQKYNEFAEGGDTKHPVTTGGTGYIPENNIDIKKRLYDNVVPFGYNNPVERIASAVFLNKPSDKQEYAGNRDILDDLWGTYLGIPRDKRHYDPVLTKSKYRPTKEKDTNTTYYSIPYSNEDKDYIIKEALWDNGETKQLLNPELGTFTVSQDRDSKGQYVSYYDNWNLNPFKGITNVGNKLTSFLGLDKIEDLSLGLGNPVEIYDRIYLDDYYGVPKENRGGTYLPEVTVHGRKHSDGGSIHIKPENRGKFTALKERTGHSATWFKEHGTPAQKKMATFALNARKWKHGDGGNLFAEAGQIQTSKPYYDPDSVLHYNRALPDIVITPDSKKSPAERAVLERERRRAHDTANGSGTYNAKASREQTELEKIASQKAWENSIEKKALDYGQAAATGIGMGADIVSHLPIYSSLKGARVLSEAKTPTDYIEGGLWLAPIGNAAYQGVKPYAKKAATEAAIAWDLRNPEVPEDFQKIESISIPVNSKNIKETPFFKWGNDERFAVQPSKDTYKSIIEQLKEARNYKISTGYKDLVKRFTQESKNKNLIFNEDLFDNGNTTLSKLTLSDRSIGELGEYFPQTNSIDLDIAQIGDLKVPFHEGIHWQRVGAPADKIGPKFEKWLEARRAGDPNEAQLFEEFRNSTEYERYYQRKTADKAIQDKVEEALYPSADETLRNRGELQAYGLEAGKAIGIEPFSEYPGIVDALTAIEKARKYSPQLRDVKSGGEENVKRFWDILTGNYIPSTVIGAFGINSYLNK